MDLKTCIRSIPDYPKPGILFYDIGTLLANGQAWQETVRQVVERVTPFRPDVFVGMEARGFLVGAAVAAQMGKGFVMARKKGKLPGETVAHTYDLEYGTDTIAMQDGIIQPGQRVVVVDDLLATGGTAAAAIELIRKLGGEVVGSCFVIELAFLQGRKRLEAMNVPVATLLAYDK